LSDNGKTNICDDGMADTQGVQDYVASKQGRPQGCECHHLQADICADLIPLKKTHVLIGQGTTATAPAEVEPQQFGFWIYHKAIAKLYSKSPTSAS
jgi:hypothetical protein